MKGYPPHSWAGDVALGIRRRMSWAGCQRGTMGERSEREAARAARVWSRCGQEWGRELCGKKAGDDAGNDAGSRNGYDV
jgi:hypothetical protein